jgi:hypothetical protein
MHRDHLHGASCRCRSGAAESTGVDQGLTSIIASRVLSGAQVGAFFNGQSRPCRQLAGRHSPALLPDVRARRSPSLESSAIPKPGYRSDLALVRNNFSTASISRAEHSADSQWPLRGPQRSWPTSFCPVRQDRHTRTNAQILGHNSLETLATPASTGVASGPSQLFADALPRSDWASRWPARLSRRGPDDDVSHDCACLNSSESEW